VTEPRQGARPRLSLTSVRYATAADLPLLAGIEADADTTFDSVMSVAGWPPPVSGAARQAMPGVLLVAGQPALGFAHLVEVTTEPGRPAWHLEQIAVRPQAARRGIGRMLLRAALGIAHDRGAGELTLMTYADVAWNGPWYAREGFSEVVPEDHPRVWARLAPLRVVEHELGLGRGGRRIGMVAALADSPRPRDAVSVIPVRQGAGELEVFVQHRALTMDFAAGAVVFPGGRVDPVDRVVAAERRIDVMRACGVREVAEETGARIDPRALLDWDRWITPVRYPKRFDVRFFLLPVERGGEFTHRTAEARHSEWVSVPDLVHAVESGRLSMVPPTRTIIDELSALATLDALVALRPQVQPVRHDLTAARPRR
jgi:8-oxo-dGTP pyrophosphatase MutT (NUDIX family)